MDKPIREIKDRLQQALSKRNVSPNELAIKTNIPKSSISQYMSGYAKPKQDRIYIISQALEINPTWLLGYDVSMELETSNVIATEFMLDSKEIDHIKKYRQLNDDGKEMVDMILNREHQFLEYRKKMEEIKKD